MRNGYLGVDLFFLVSGFLLALPWFVRAARGEPAPSARGFYMRRVRRIVPAYYVQLAILFVVVLPLLRGPGYWRSDLYVYLWNAVAHALFLHNTTPLTSGSMEVNGALWTLAVEAQFYVLIPLLVPLFVRWTHAALAACARARRGSGIARRFGPRLASWPPRWRWARTGDGRSRSCATCCCTSCPAISRISRSASCWDAHGCCGGPRTLRASSTRWTIAAACALAALYRFVAIDGHMLGGLNWIVAPLCLGVLVFRAATTRWPPAQRLLAQGPLAFLGRISYSAYLYHLPLLLLWNAFAGALPPWTSLPLYLAALLAVSWLSWRFVERKVV